MYSQKSINDLHRKFENFVISYDSLLGILNSSGHREIVKLISKRLEGILGFPNIIDIDNIEDNEYSEIIKEIKDYVSDQEKKFKQELKITEIIGEALGAKGE